MNKTTITLFSMLVIGLAAHTEAAHNDSTQRFSSGGNPSVGRAHDMRGSSGSVSAPVREASRGNGPVAASQGPSGGRSQAVMRNDATSSRFVSPAAPATTYSAPRITSSPGASYTPSQTRSPERASSSAPNVAAGSTMRTYTPPRVTDNRSGSQAVQTRMAETPRNTTFTRETPTRDVTATAPTVTREPRTSGLPGATSRREQTIGTTHVPTPSRLANEDSARNSGTARTYTPPQNKPSVSSAATPTVTRRYPDSLQPTAAGPSIPRTQNTALEKPRAARSPSVTSPSLAQERPSALTKQTGLTSSDRTRSRDSAGQPTRDLTDRTLTTRATTRDSAASRDTSAARRMPVSRLATPDTRLVAGKSTSGTADMRFGSTGYNTRTRTASQPAMSLRSMSQDATGNGQNSRIAASSSRPPHSSTGRVNSPSDHNPSSSSRYGDGRTAVYHSPGRPGSMNHNPTYGRGPFRGGADHHNDGHGYNHRPAPYMSHYSPHAFRPVWYGPVAYPVSGFAFSWNSGSYGVAFASYSPAYACTSYYDSWHCGGWGYSGVYYGGWRNNWYGGFSYVYNPWPVYRTCYLYDPEPVVVTRTETVYFTEPAVTRTETVYVNEPPVTAPYDANYSVASYPATQAATIPAAAAYAPAPEPAPTAWDAAPAVQRTETVTEGCFCPCHCNGQRACTCDYPCGAEFAVVADQFNLGYVYSSYAETLDPETIWSSYAGLDRWDVAQEPFLNEATASSENRQN